MKRDGVRRAKLLRWRTLCELGTAVLSFAAVARAAATEGDGFVQLNWQRGASAQSCPERQVVEQLVRLRLGRDPFTANAPRTIEARIDHTGTAWHVELHVRDATGSAQGQRVFDVAEDSCGQVVDAVALAVALAIDPNASIAAVPSSTARLEPNEIPPEPQTTPAPATHTWNSAPMPVQPVYAYAGPPRSERPRAYTAQLSLRGLLAGGLLPGAAPGLAVAGSIGGKALQVSLGLSYFPEARHDAQLSLGLTTLDVGVCGNVIQSREVIAGLCGNAHVGSMHAVINGLQPLDTGDHFYWALSLGPKITWRAWSPLLVEAGLWAWVTPTRPQFWLYPEGTAPIYEVRAASAVGFMGVGWSTD